MVQSHGNFWIFVDDNNIISPMVHAHVIVHSTGGKFVADSLHCFTPLGMDIATALERHLREQLEEFVVFIQP
jgi:hypothetical protein